MAQYKPYPVYKNSGIPWLGEVPEHWEVRKLKCVADFQSGEMITSENITETGDYPVFGGGGFRGYTNAFTNDGNHVLIGRQGALCGNIKYAEGKFWASEHAIVTYPKISIATIYLGEILRVANLGSLSQTAAQPGISIGQIKHVKIPTPPPSEQTTIARFLDYKLSKINRFIRKKKQLIKLLNEQKAAIINQAVTKGLDPYAPMKESGIEWLGEVPAHWEVRKLKYVADFNPSKESSNYSKDDRAEVVFLPMEKVTEDGRINCEIKLPVSEVWEGYTFFQRGDVVFAKITPCFENGKGAWLSELETEIGFGTTEFTVLRPNEHLIFGHYLYLILNSKYFRSIGERFMEGAAGQKRVPTDFVKNFSIAVPEIFEQHQIVSFIESETAIITTTIATIEKEIALVEEYKTALIAEAVTGKIDVREYDVPELENEEQMEEELEDDGSMEPEDAAEYQTEETE